MSGLDGDVGGAVALLFGVLLLGIRHGFDRDHIAAITDITSTAVATEPELRVGRPTTRNQERPGARHEQPDMVAALGSAALMLGAVLPSWVDTVMGRVVGLTLLALGAWLLLAAFRHARYGHEFHLRSRWMLMFEWAGTVRDRLTGRPSTVRAARTRPYGARTSYGIGMIHGIGAETATQVLLISVLGGAAGRGLGIPLMLSFIVGLVLANTVIVAISASGFAGAGSRPRLNLSVGLVAGVISIVLGAFFVLGWEAGLPDLAQLLDGSPGV